MQPINLLLATPLSPVKTPDHALALALLIQLIAEVPGS